MKDLDITKDEIERLEDAFKKEEFRKLFFEYAQEISDPKNRAIYEEEIKKMENERGMDVKFVHPTPGYVFKSSISGSETKAFVNICSNDVVEKPSCKSETGENGRRGLMWSIPHSFSPPRDDLDRHQVKCQVFDVVFHPDTLRMASQNKAFKNMIEGTAIDGIDRQFGIALDKNKIKYLKMNFKGTPQPTVIRNKTSSPPEPVPDNDILKDFPYPYDNKTTAEKTKANEEKQKEIKAKKEAEKKKVVEPGPTVPNYSIVHQTDMDYQSYANPRENYSTSTRPKNLIISIDLPLLHSAKTIDLDVFEKSLVLTSERPAAYSLNIDLPYAIDDSNSNAKFDKAKHQLVITLPVIQEKSVKVLGSGDAENLNLSEENSVSHEHGSPLIQVINSPENGKLENVSNQFNESSEPNSNGNLNGIESHEFSDQKDIWPDELETRTKNIKYILPEYSYQQDKETISLTAKVKNVSEESLTKSYCMSGTRQLATFRFISVGSGGFPVHYCLVVRLEEGLNIAPAQTAVEVTEEGVGVVMLKGRDCRAELWSRMEVGVDADSLEEKTFDTEETLKHEYDALVALCQGEKSGAHGAPGAPEMQENERVPPLMSLVDEDEEEEREEEEGGKFAIQIGCCDGSEDAEEVWEEQEQSQLAQLGERIQVVHKHKPTNLHGILKQRSVSESSIDDSLSGGKVSRENSNSSEVSAELSPRSLESDDSVGHERLKRSVSFSEHIDTTTFKTNAAVSTMTVALKSKRRRQRKRERRHQAQRQRHHSTGSEYSSDEHDLRPFSTTDQHSDDAQEASTSKLEMTKTVEESVQDELVDELVLEKNKMNLTKDQEEGAIARSQDSDELSEPEEPDEPTISENSESKPSETMLSWEDAPNTNPEHKTECAFQFSNSVMFDLDVE